MDKKTGYFLINGQDPLILRVSLNNPSSFFTYGPTNPEESDPEGSDERVRGPQRDSIPPTGHRYRHTMS